MIYHEEILDIVTPEDMVIGAEKKSVIYEQKLNTFRVINAFVINSAGELWIPRRHAQKKLFPLHLDASVGGHVLSGESYEAAFMRETEEELNIQLDSSQLKPLCRLTPHTDGTSAFMWVYGIFQDTPPAYNQDDFIEYYWLKPAAFFEKLKSGDKAKSDLPILVNAIRELI
jgi:isopentenyldiphosphate isomerase